MRSAFLYLLAALGSNIVNAIPSHGPHYQHVLENLDESGGIGFSKGVDDATRGCEVDGADELEFGVGIEFTLDDAIIAIQFKNGTFLDIPKIDIDEEADMELIYRHINHPSLSSPTVTTKPARPCSSLRTLLSPFYVFLEKVNNFFYPALVHQIPRPISPSIPDSEIHVAILTASLTHIKNSIESHLGRCISNPPTSIIIHPELAGLAKSGVMGLAFSAVDMDLLRVGLGDQQRIAAAWKGMGYDDEPGSVKRTLAVSFDDDALVVSTASIRAANEIVNLESRSYPQLGYLRKDDFNMENEGLVKGYWDAVNGVIISAAGKGKGEKEVERVLIMGDRAGEKRLLDALWWVLQELGVGNVYIELQVEGFDVRTVVARGAAAMALGQQS